MKFFTLMLFLAINIGANSLAVVHYNPFLHAQKIMTMKHSRTRIMRRSRKIHLLAIFNDKALLNGKFYKKNDRVNGFLIVHIYKNRILLKKGKKFMILPLMKGSLSQMQMKQTIKRIAY